MATLEELTEQARTEVESEKPLSRVVVENGVATTYELTDEEYEALIIARGESYYHEQQHGWKQNRVNAYKPVEEQLDMLYWDSVNGTTTWEDHVAQVKSDNPKVSE